MINYQGNGNVIVHYVSNNQEVPKEKFVYLGPNKTVI